MTARNAARGERPRGRSAARGTLLVWGGAIVVAAVVVTAFVLSGNTDPGDKHPASIESNAASVSTPREPALGDASPAADRTETPADIDATIEDAATATATPAADAPPERGAAVPFVTLEAEAPTNATTGRVVRLSGLPDGPDHSPELEASGRAYVELSAPGEYVEFRNPSAANALVIRHCIPDAPDGGGISATLGLYVGGVRREDVTLTSMHA